MHTLSRMSTPDAEHITLHELAKTIDHAELKPETAPERIVAACEMAAHYGVASVCVQSSYVPLAAECLAGSSVDVCSVIGFPHGAASSIAKACEAEDVLRSGAREVDMVIAIGRLLAGDEAYVLADIRGVRTAVGPEIVLKVILENCFLNREQKILGCRLAEAAGANFVKTSTGFGPTGSTVEDVQLMRATVGLHVGVKASGGIRSLQDALDALRAGASRLGVSSTGRILENLRNGLAYIAQT